MGKYSESKLREVYKTLNYYCKRDGFILNSKYKNAKENLEFIHIESQIKHYQTWDTIRTRKCINIINNKQYYTNTVKDKLFNLDFFCLTSGLFSDKTVIEYNCNKCKHKFKNNCNFIKNKLTHCTKCNNKTIFNGGINKTTVLRNPFKIYYLYFVNFDYVNYNIYKIGLFKSFEISKRYNYQNFKNVNTILCLKLPLYIAYFIEQYIIKFYKDFKFDKIKFGGYTESFNENLDYLQVLNKIMSLLEVIQDRKPCELLETPEEDNQQLSIIEI